MARGPIRHTGWFTTLDPYLQLLLEKASSKLVTVNMHEGLHQYTSLPYVIASAPALFQKTMDTILQGIPNVICYILVRWQVSLAQSG